MIGESGTAVGSASPVSRLYHGEDVLTPVSSVMVTRQVRPPPTKLFAGNVYSWVSPEMVTLWAVAAVSESVL